MSDTAASVSPPSASLRSRLRTSLWRHRLALAGWCLVLGFIALVARFWHPYYGMTRLLQLNTAFAEVAIPEIGRQPVFIYPDHGGYDGLFYAQLAYHPLLDDPELVGALDNPGFRARRILMSATAWLLAVGREAWIADVFACLNIAAWLGLAALLWRRLPVDDWRSWLAWAGILLSAGALHSVRQSLTDLPALLIIAGAMFAIERGHLKSGVALFAAAALTRETAILATAGAADTAWRRSGTWLRNIVIGLGAALPLALWLLYVRHQFGPGDAGTANFSIPLLGWWRKWPELIGAYGHPAFRWLVTTTLLATIGISAQALFFVVYRRVNDGWWRIGAIHVALAIVLGRAVWEGHPGAFTRVLLPLSLAFAVGAVRWRVHPAWLVAGLLPLFAGLEPWRSVVHHRDDLSSGVVQGRGYFVQLQDGFFPRDHHRGHTRSWSAGAGRLEFRFTHPPAAEQLHLTFGVRAFGPRTLTVRDGQGVVWSGAIGEPWQQITCTMRPADDGRWVLHFASPEPPRREADVPGARDLAFAIREVELDAAASP